MSIEKKNHKNLNFDSNTNLSHFLINKIENG